MDMLTIPHTLRTVVQKRLVLERELEVQGLKQTRCTGIEKKRKNKRKTNECQPARRGWKPGASFYPYIGPLFVPEQERNKECDKT